MTLAAGAGVGLDGVDAELAARRAWPRFAPALEARYEADTAAHRRRELLAAGAISLLVFDLFLLNDWLVRPDVLAVAAACRGLATLFGLAVLVLVARPALPARWRENLMASALPVTMGCAAVLAALSPQPRAPTTPSC